MALLTTSFGQNLPSTDPSHYENWDSDSLYNTMAYAIDLENGKAEYVFQYVEIGLARAVQEQNHVKASYFAAEGAHTCEMIGMYQKGLDYSLQALRFASETADLVDDIWALYRISGAHSELGNNEKALEEARRALELSFQRDSLSEIAWSYNMVGEIHRRMNHLDSAVIYYEKGVEAFEELGNKGGWELIQHNLGLTFAEMGEFDRAMEIFSRPLSDFFENEVHRQLEEGMAILHIIRATQTIDSALAYGEDLVTLATTTKHSSWVKRLKKGMSEMYQEAGFHERAWQYHLASDSLEEFQTGERIQYQARVAEFQYEMELLQTEQDLKFQQNRNQILLWLSIILVAGFIVLVAIIQITKNKRIRNVNHQLFLQNEQLDDLLGEKDNWINLMAHDLKAPLNSIGGLLDLLRENDIALDVKQDIIKNITFSVDKGTELISQLLEIARLEAGEVGADIKTTDLNELVTETESLFQPYARKKAITLVTQLPNDRVELETDSIHAQRILENLVSNAIKFSPQGKKVELILEKGQDEYMIHVRDEGPGLTQEDQKNLFRKFQKLSARPTGGEASTGLGLSIVKQLALRINAEILVSSIPGKGATFTLRLPQSLSMNQYIA